MPFEIHKVEHSSGPANETGVKVTLSKRLDKPARLVVIIDSKTMDKLGWQHTDLLRVLIGDREQYGLIRLLPHQDGTAIIEAKKAPKNGTVYYRINLGVVPSLPNEKQEPRWAQWHFVDGGNSVMEITLPSWLKRETVGKVQVHLSAPPASLAPMRAAGPIAPAVAAAANFQRPHRDRLPGDPPAGRSALDTRDK